MTEEEEQDLEDENAMLVLFTVGRKAYEALADAVANKNLEITCVASSMGALQERANILNVVQPTNFRVISNDNKIAFDFPEYVERLDFRDLGVSLARRNKEDYSERCQFGLHDVTSISFNNMAEIFVGLWEDNNVFKPRPENLLLHVRHKSIKEMSTNE